MYQDATRKEVIIPKVKLSVHNFKEHRMILGKVIIFVT